MSDDNISGKNKSEKSKYVRSQKMPEYDAAENEINDFFREEFERVNYWLSFAEAKNAALIAINIAIMAVIINVFKDAPVLCVISSIALLLSSCFCLISFIPNLSSIPLKKMEKGRHEGKSASTVDPNKINLLFYGSIAEVGGTETYYNAVINKYFSREVSSEKVSTDDQAKKNQPQVVRLNRSYDLAEEIVINSQITVNKYVWFKLAVKVDFIGIILVVCTLIAA